ncbi:glycosyltransferase [Leptothoe kymatousa]|uniref:cellulose synthase (UDP-forming) n=1 Tax=Leptothoe kymatousa TAU-MAC 1615 TaxID=2364775 RepID=A0ABS5Y731_9CYAN|nr:glycosyltransferase [Leptothoe kymatousa]MBT9313581.1 glycosyltransferase [Leptothoe kymatousa TAU-MAC 1615]
MMGQWIGLKGWKSLILGTTVFFLIYDVWLFSAYFSTAGALAERIWPYGLAILALLLLRRISPKYPPKPLLICLVLGMTGLQVYYLTWRINHTLVLTWPNILFSLGLLGFELLSVFNSWINNLLLAASTQRSLQVEQRLPQVRTGKYRPTVDIFVPTYNEPIEVVTRTLIGCQSLKYPRQHKKIWLLDDGDRPEFCQLAKDLKCHYLARPEHRHAKAGNLCYALDHSDGEIVVVFDADFVPVNTFLERTLSLFVDNRELAMVVTPQHFYNPDPPQKNLGARFLPGDQTNFYHVIQPARDAANAVVCSGSSIVYRRSALEKIGGIPCDSIVEDYVTGMLLQAQGFKTVYLNEILSVGAAANTIGEYIKQRGRWAEGTLRTVCSHYNPLWLPGLNPLQRFTYLSGVLFWMEECLKLVSYVAPILYFLLGVQSVAISFDAQATQGLMLGLMILMIISWLRGSLILLSIYNVLQGTHVLRVVLSVLTRPKRKITFKVTDKTLADYQTRLNLDTMFPVLGLLMLTLVAVFYGVWQGEAAKCASALVYLVWAQVNVVLLSAGLVAGASTPKDRGYPRVACQVPCRVVKDNGYEGDGTIIDISEAGVGLKLDVSTITLGRHEKIWLDIPSIPVRVQAEVRHFGRVTGCLFTKLDPQTRWKLVNFSYCRPTRWQVPHLANEWDTLRAIWAGLYQLHPFSRRR